MPGTRAEPHLGAGPDAAPAPNGSDWVRYAALHEEPELLKPRRRFSRLAWMSGIFVFGTAVGLGAAWWFSTPAPFQPLTPNVAHAPGPVNVPERPPGDKGIAQSELPYDGRPPAEAAAPPMALKPAIPEDVPPVAERKQPAPAAMATSGGSGEDAVTEEKPQTAAQEKSQTAAASPPPAAATAAPVPAPKAAPKAVPVTRQAAEQPRSRESVPARVAEAKPAVQKRSPARIAKDREIERIRQQAADELKRKNEAKRAAEEAAAAKPRQASPQVASNGNTNMRAMLARCESAANFIFREQCKWQLCSGKWGKNGCPAYNTQASTY